MIKRFEDGIFGLVAKEDLLQIGYDVNRPNDPVDQLIGDEKTDNIIAYWESIADEYGIPVMAQFHSFDVETQTTLRKPVDVHNIEKGLIKVKIPQSERLRALLDRGIQNESELYNRVLRDAYNLAEEVFTRAHVAKNELLATGKVTINENGLNLTVDYGVPEKNLNKKLYVNSPDLPDQLQALKQEANTAGAPLTGIYCSSIAWAKLRRNVGIQRQITGTFNTGILLTDDQLKNWLRTEMGITRILINDAVYSLPLTMGEDGRPVVHPKKYYPTDRITFFSAGNELGKGLWGNPPEVSAAKFMEVEQSEVSPYVFVSQYAEPDPAVTWTKASALYMPVLFNPNSLYICHIEDGEGGLLTVGPMDADAQVWGHTISDLQEGVMVGEDKILGTLKYVSTGTLATDWGAGNFMALQFGGDAFDNAQHIWVGLDPSAGSGLQDVLPDPEKSGVFKVTSKAQKFKVIVDFGTYTETRDYDLSGLTLANA